MTYLQMYLGEFDREMAITRKHLERVPEEKADWKPHVKSMSLGRLAKHVATLPGYVAFVLKRDALDVADPAFHHAAPAPKRQAWLEAFDHAVAESRAAIVAAKDEELGTNWSLRDGESVIFSMPRAAALRGFALNHLIHHRAQLGLYLRLNEVPVPSTYGPSADEAPPAPR